MPTATERVRIGDCVKVQDSTYRGRVFKIHDSFRETGAKEAWLKIQKHPHTAADKKARWASILVDGGGSMLVAERRIEVIPDFKVDNPYIAEHFRT